MFAVGEHVISLTNGICKIEDIICRDWSGESKEYFNKAVHMLHSELAFAMKCKEEEVEEIIKETIVEV